MSYQLFENETENIRMTASVGSPCPPPDNSLPRVSGACHCPVPLADNGPSVTQMSTTRPELVRSEAGIITGSFATDMKTRTFAHRLWELSNALPFIGGLNGCLQIEAEYQINEPYTREEAERASQGKKEKFNEG